MPDAADDKHVLRRYLQSAREALVWKLDGLSEYEIRRPLVPTGTNLLGLVKHAAIVEIGYFVEAFGQSFEPLPAEMQEGSADNADMWATADESREQIVELYRRAWALADGFVESVPLDTTGHVPWWPEGRNDITLHTLLVHLIAETNRHAGHADLVRELIDGAAGLRHGNSNLPPGDGQWWTAYRQQLEDTARRFAEPA